MLAPRSVRRSIAAILAAALPILLYLPALSFGFVFDDRPLLIDNPVVQSPSSVAELFTAGLDPHARAQETQTTNYLRPLFLALASLLYALFGAEPLPWHLTAVVLHGLLGALSFKLLQREGLSVGAALAASLLFSFHPAHVQSVAWISGIQDLLFALLALLAYLAYRASAARAPSVQGLLLLACAYSAALLAKEPAVGLLLFVLAEAAFLQLASRRLLNARPQSADLERRPWPELGLLLVLTFGYFAYRIAVLGSLAHPFPTAPALPEALASVPLAILTYLRDLLWPVDLFLLHPARPLTSWLTLQAAATTAGLALILLLAWRAIGWRPALQRPLFFFAAWLAPTLALWAVNPEWMVMDRYLLVPSLALGWALVLCLPAELRPRKQLLERLLQPVAATLLIATFGLLSLLGMQSFRNEDVFWKAAIQADGGSSTAWTEWAKRRVEAGELKAAEEALDKAIALDPRAQLPRLQRALLALRRGRFSAATQELEGLIERNPAYLPAWRNLVVARDRSGDAAGAASTLSRALELFPNDAQLWTHLAVIRRGQGRGEEALAALARAAALAPRDPVTALRQALLLAELGRRNEAAQAAGRGLALRPSPEIRAQLEALTR